MLTRFAIAVVAVVFSLPAFAAPFPGWQRQIDNNTVILTSPPDAQQLRAALFVGSVDEVSGSVDDWFTQTVNAFIGDVSLMKARSGIQRAQTMLIETLQYVRSDGNAFNVFVMAYAVGDNKYQPMAGAYPLQIKNDDPRVFYMLDFVAAAYHAKFAMTDATDFDAKAPEVRRVTTVNKSAPPPAPSAPPRQTQSAPSQQGKNCYRKPIWGLRISPFCKPSGVCNDLTIKDYETVCE